MLKKSIPPKEELLKYYISENITAKNLASMYDVTVATLFNWLKNYGIKKFEDLSHIKSLNDIQMEMINGSMLGDGSCSIGTNHKNWKFSKGQSQKPRGKVQGKEYENKIDYMLWHIKILENLALKLSECKGKKAFINNKEISTGKAYCVNSRAHPIFTSLGYKWYKNENGVFLLNKNNWKIKQVPQDLKLTPLTVAVWFCDDGIHKPQCKMASFCTDCFSKEENLFLIDRLKIDLNINAYLGDRNRIFVKDHPHQDYFNLMNIIKPHIIWSCFKYKVNLENYEFCTLNGENHWNAKWTEKQVREIIQLRMDGYLLDEIAYMKNTTKSNVHCILHENWNHIEKPNFKNAINKKNKLGITGVYQYGKTKFYSQIAVRKEKYKEGPFLSLEEAIISRKNLEQKYAK